MQTFITDLTLLLSMPDGSEWILIVIVVLIMFSGEKIPELMKGIGKGMRELIEVKDPVKINMEEEIKDKDAEDSPPPPVPPPVPPPEVGQ